MVLLRSIATVGGFTLISRVLGFLRDILIATVLGAGAGADVFFVAFKLPNLFRRLFAEGAFSMAFVPMFADVRGPHRGGWDRGGQGVRRGRLQCPFLGPVDFRRRH